MSAYHNYAGMHVPNPAIAAPPLARRVAWVLGIAGTVLFLYSASGLGEYLAGLRNESPFSLGRAIPRLFLSFLVALALGIWVIVWHARGVRGWWSGVGSLSIVILAFLFTCCPGVLRYEDGLVHWARRNIDVESVRAWLESGPTGPAVTLPVSDRTVLDVPLANWPAAITGLTPVPNQVYLLAEGGVILSWGVPAEFNDRRGVYIAPDADAAIPPDFIWFKPIGAGIWAAAY
jgi:hypothetical protein